MNRQQTRFTLALITIVITSVQAEAQVAMGPGGVPAPLPSQLAFQPGYTQPVQPAVYSQAGYPGGGQVMQASYGCDAGGCDSFGGGYAPPCSGCGLNCGGQCGSAWGNTLRTSGCSSCGSNCGGSCGGGALAGVGSIAGAGAMAGGGLMAGLNPFSANLPKYGGYGTQVFGAQHGPYGTGGCCLPRWFDVHAEALYWQRDLGDATGISSRGVSGPIVLSTDDLDLEHELGFRITGAYNLFAGTGLELTYFGGFDWSGAGSVTGNGDLFHVFSDFGQLPVPGLGFPETDAANFHGIEYSSELDNLELNLRRRWVSASCLLHGSWLAGVRYIQYQEDLIATSRTDLGSMSYAVEAQNDMIGFQLGAEGYVCISPRMKVGADIEAGVYGNRASQTTNFVSTLSPGINEDIEDDEAAFAYEANLIGLFRLTPRLTIRGGYQFFFLDNVATGVGNFNTQSPFALNRTAFIDNNGEAFFHGGNLGFEFLW